MKCSKTKCISNKMTVPVIPLDMSINIWNALTMTVVNFASIPVANISPSHMQVYASLQEWLWHYQLPFQVGYLHPIKTEK